MDGGGSSLGVWRGLERSRMMGWVLTELMEEVERGVVEDGKLFTYT